MYKHRAEEVESSESRSSGRSRRDGSHCEDRGVQAELTSGSREGIGQGPLKKKNRETRGPGGG